jgi:hypothetical protein
MFRTGRDRVVRVIRGIVASVLSAAPTFNGATARLVLHVRLAALATIRPIFSGFMNVESGREPVSAE